MAEGFGVLLCLASEGLVLSGVVFLFGVDDVHAKLFGWSPANMN